VVYPSSAPRCSGRSRRSRPRGRRSLSGSLVGWPEPEWVRWRGGGGTRAPAPQARVRACARLVARACRRTGRPGGGLSYERPGSRAAWQEKARPRPTTTLSAAGSRSAAACRRRYARPNTKVSLASCGSTFLVAPARTASSTSRGATGSESSARRAWLFLYQDKKASGRGKHLLQTGEPEWRLSRLL
jgi:hypothetical protein